MGTPRSGKTTFLRLLYDIIYADNNGVIPAELYSIINEYDIPSANLELDRIKISCTRIEEVACNLESTEKKGKAIYFPIEMEEAVKVRIFLTFESYYSFMELLLKRSTIH
ncbi:hypothetical protein [Saccharolobus islandicus]|uniref:Uncharacterized protein n=1 Tax=Saccharolobus islandicus LAL14/1 TaxID=1241935 RepID=M9U7J2_SACIS|nr:hypothetical protein [Sulfolobus islandicus]AGJ62107.1 Hypothetical Protein SiL_0647 [Sulfolobus islandicus LAL14/1]